MPFCVGLTGGIGSGKSTVAEIFRRLGAGVIDTDEISHALTRPGAAGFEAIVAAFGADYVRPDGGLDRARLRALVFADPAARGKLEAILHPMIRSQALQALAAETAPYAILVVPLLVETGAWRDLVQRVLVVDCPEEEQLRRTMARSGLGADEVRAIMAAQAPRRERLAAADDILPNLADRDALERRVAELDRFYRRLAARHPAPP